MLVTFLSDFGLDDAFVGICHGVIKRIAPDAEIIDITHGIEPRSVLHGAVTLATALPYMPVGVHLAVVDPGVGSERRAVALRTEDGRLHVGPDNGLLLLAADRVGGVAAGWEVTNRAYALEPVSATFHGRDVFAPAAAHLARGLDPAELGPPLDPTTLVRIEPPEPVTVLSVDGFGNVQLNLRDARVESGTRVEVGGRRALVANTFADCEPGGLLLYKNSSGYLSLAVNGGSAAQLLGLRAGDGVEIRGICGKKER